MSTQTLHAGTTVFIYLDHPLRILEGKIIEVRADGWYVGEFHDNDLGKFRESIYAPYVDAESAIRGWETITNLLYKHANRTLV